MPAKYLQCPKVFRVAAACTGPQSKAGCGREKVGARNLYKSKMFFQAREAGNIPAHITNMFDNAKKHPSGERARRIEIVNTLFEQSENSKGWTMCANKLVFTEAETRYPEGYRNFE